MIEGKGSWMKPDKSECINTKLAAIMHAHVRC